MKTLASITARKMGKTFMLRYWIQQELAKGKEVLVITPTGMVYGKDYIKGTK